MVVLEKKYEIGVKRFGFVNWIGFFSLISASTQRWIIVIGQTIFGPALTALLF